MIACYMQSSNVQVLFVETVLSQDGFKVDGQRIGPFAETGSLPSTFNSSIASNIATSLFFATSLTWIFDPANECFLLKVKMK